MTPGTQTIHTLVLVVSWVIKRWIKISSSISLPGSVSTTMVFVAVLERNEVMIVVLRGCCFGMVVGMVGQCVSIFIVFNC